MTKIDHLILKAVVLLSTFLIGVAISSIAGRQETSSLEGPCTQEYRLGVSCNHADYSPLPVSYCDLMASPGIYENKLVRLPIDQRIGTRRMVQRDEICTKGDSDFHLDIVAGPNYFGTRRGMNAWNPEPRVDEVILLTGRFRRTPSSSHNYQLELLRIDTFTF